MIMNSSAACVIPVIHKTDGIRLMLNTDRLPHGHSPYFEITSLE